MSLGFGFGMPRRVFAAPLTPQSLFSTGAQGAWYDPSDRSTLFQDAAGTVPVTAVEQPVGLMLDKSGQGNHANQTTAASRPVLSARYNLLTKTEQLDDAVWDKTNLAAVNSNVDGVLDEIVENSLSGKHELSFARVFIPGVGYTLSATAKQGAGARFFNMNIAGGAPGATFDLQTGQFTTTGNILGNTNVVASAVHLGGGLYRCSLSWTHTSAYTSTQVRLGILNNKQGTGAGVYVGDGVSSIICGQAQLTVTNSLLDNRYQRVNTATDYDAVGFRPYLRFDGVDDFLVTPSIDFTSTDKMTVFAGVRKLSDLPSQMIAEFGPGETPRGGWFVASQYTSSYNYFANSVGVSINGRATANLSGKAPTQDVLSLQTDFAGAALSNRIKFRKNGGVFAGGSGTIDAGSGGNCGNYPLFIGCKSNGTLPFNGHLYSMVIVGKAVTAGELSNTETYVATKTGVVL